MPKKHKPSYTDQVLPIFDQPEESPQLPPTLKEQEDAAKISWRRLAKYVSLGCEVCAHEHLRGERGGIGVASYCRTFGGTVMYLCLRHTTEQRHRDQLEGLARG